MISSGPRPDVSGCVHIGDARDAPWAKPHPSPKIPMNAHPRMNVIFRPNRSASRPRKSSRQPCPRRQRGSAGGRQRGVGHSRS